MPALPSKSSRRKYPTPRTKPEADDVWKRTFQIMGIEPLCSFKNQKDTMASGDSSAASAMPGPSLAQGSKKKKTILDLPAETQTDILRYSNTTDLIALSLVSKHFRNIAAEQLYRSFRIVFPDADENPNDLPIDGLAGGLHTFVTSDYDYAQHLREIILEPLSGGAKGERAYRHFHYDVSCGKFLNTLFLLTLRKSKALEAFRWDVRVELSRDVFKTLHGIQSLQHLHLRMQLGQSLYQAPPVTYAPDTVDNLGMVSPFPHHTGPSFIPVPGFLNGSYPNAFSLGTLMSTKAHQIHVKSLLPDAKQVPPTLSGFKNLKTLAILDMDTLDYISELKACIRNSSSTLSSLRLSFSEDLANKSRKPPPEIVLDDDSEQEDEFGQAILPPGPPPGPPGVLSAAVDSNAPSKAIKALEEKKNQEEFLAKIFGMEKEEKKALLKESKSHLVIEGEIEPITMDELRKKFLRTLAPVTRKLFSTAKDGLNLGPEEAEVLEIIKKFSGVTEVFENSKKGEDQPSESTGSSTAKATPASSSASMDERAESGSLTAGDNDERGLFDEPTIKKKKANDDSDVSNPDDINVEEPEGQELAVDPDPASESPADPIEDVRTDNEAELPDVVEDVKDDAKSEVSPSLHMDSIAMANRMQVLESHLKIHSTTCEILSETEKLKERIEVLRADVISGKPMHEIDYMELLAAEKAYAKYNARIEEMTRDLKDLGEQMDQLENKGQAVITDGPGSTEMSDYIRSTRGLTLTSLAIYLIPIRASILSRAVDLRVLQSVTLLNVGHQIPFWNIMARENILAPLPLHKIHTDNVTLPFLVFVSNLDHVAELLLLERTQRARVESTAAKTTVTMEQIRRIVLKKHVATLKILILRNETGSDWDMDAKTAILLCNRAKLLGELAVSFGVKTMHTFLQFMPGLISLRAFHTIQFRNDDTCVAVCREFRKFMVDCISHNSDMILEYIALDNSVARLVRRLPLPIQKVDYKGKGKEVSGSLENSSKKTYTQMVLGSNGSWPDGASLALGLGTSVLDEESEDDDGSEWGLSISGKTLKVETIEGIRFCDVTGVRIFEKDVLGGRL